MGNLNPNVIDHINNSGHNGTWRKMTQEYCEKLPVFVAWQVWYTDGTVYSSEEVSWSSLPRIGMQILMAHYENKSRGYFSAWDEYALLGDEETKLGEMMEPEEEFYKILKIALGDEWRPF